MNVSGSIPAYIARAYGARPATAPAPARSPTQDLVAGRVRAAARPEGPDEPRAALSLYTRAADKIEAAVAVQVGRTLDVTG